MAEAAKTYLARGWSPIRLHGVNAEGLCTCMDRDKPGHEKSAGKHPTDNNWQHRGLDTPEEIDDAFAAWRAGHNVGIRTGRPSGFFALDVDPDNGGRESIERLQADYEPLAESVVQKTGSGGWHIPFAMPDDFEPTNRRGGLKAYPGLDIRGTGGQIVAAPSRSAKGSYEWTHEGKPEQAPAWLLDLLRPAAPTTSAPATVVALPLEGIDDAEVVRLETYSATVRDREVDRLLAMAEAARVQPYRGEPWNQTTFDVACCLLELANSPWTMYDAAQTWKDVREHAPQDAGFGSLEIEKCLRSATGRVGAKGRPYPVARPDANAEIASWADEPGVTVDPSFRHQPEPARESTEDPSWARIGLDQFLDGTHTPQEATLFQRSDGRRLLYAGRVHSFHGESESGKSWAALAAAAEQLVQGYSVLMLDFESDAATVVGRLLAMGVSPGHVRDNFDYRRPEVRPDGIAAESAAWRALLGARYALAVVDGVTEALTVFGAASKDNDDVTAWIRGVPRRLAQRTGAAVVLVDHVTKDAESRGRFAIGGQAKMAALDGAAYVVEVIEPLGVGMLGRVSLRVGKDRPGRVRPYAGQWRKSDRTQEAAVVVIDSRVTGATTVTVEPPRATGAAEQRAGEFRPTALMERVSRHLETTVQTYTRTGLAEAVSGRKDFVRKAIEQLLTEGYLEAGGPPRSGHPTLRLAKEYRESEDKVPDRGTVPTNPVALSSTRSRSRSSTGDRGTGCDGAAEHRPGPSGTGPGPGITEGPCVTCGQPSERYGRGGTPCCADCSLEAA